jgi:hypothetical protein
MSNEGISCRTCEKCGARFLGGCLYWATGKQGDPRDLAGLVCRPFGDSRCINTMKDVPGGDTWAKRLEFINVVTSELDLPEIS